jgi:hypothetical protein
MHHFLERGGCIDLKIKNYIICFNLSSTVLRTKRIAELDTYQLSGYQVKRNKFFEDLMIVIHHPFKEGKMSLLNTSLASSTF